MRRLREEDKTKQLANINHVNSHHFILGKIFSIDSHLWLFIGSLSAICDKTNLDWALNQKTGYKKIMNVKFPSD